MTAQTEITDEQIEALSTEAASAGDTEQVAICERAIAGDVAARAECARVIAAASAQVDEDGTDGGRHVPYPTGDTVPVPLIRSR